MGVNSCKPLQQGVKCDGVLFVTQCIFGKCGPDRSDFDLKFLCNYKPTKFTNPRSNPAGGGVFKMLARSKLQECMQFKPTNPGLTIQTHYSLSLLDGPCCISKSGLKLTTDKSPRTQL
ncbi:hypothetical protein ACF0H5_000135 [Mactra antiquata]